MKLYFHQKLESHFPSGDAGYAADKRRLGEIAGSCRVALLILSILKEIIFEPQNIGRPFSWHFASSAPVFLGQQWHHKESHRLRDAGIRIWKSCNIKSYQRIITTMLSPKYKKKNQNILQFLYIFNFSSRLNKTGCMNKYFCSTYSLERAWFANKQFSISNRKLGNGITARIWRN